MNSSKHPFDIFDTELNTNNNAMSVNSIELNVNNNSLTGNRSLVNNPIVVVDSSETESDNSEEDIDKPSPEQLSKKNPSDTKASMKEKRKKKADIRHNYRGLAEKLKFTDKIIISFEGNKIREGINLKLDELEENTYNFAEALKNKITILRNFSKDISLLNYAYNIAISSPANNSTGQWCLEFLTPDVKEQEESLNAFRDDLRDPMLNTYGPKKKKYEDKYLNSTPSARASRTATLNAMVTTPSSSIVSIGTKRSKEELSDSETQEHNSKVAISNKKFKLNQLNTMPTNQQTGSKMKSKPLPSKNYQGKKKKSPDVYHGYAELAARLDFNKKQDIPSHSKSGRKREGILLDFPVGDYDKSENFAGSLTKRRNKLHKENAKNLEHFSHNLRISEKYGSYYLEFLTKEVNLQKTSLEAFKNYLREIDNTTALSSRQAASIETIYISDSPIAREIIPPTTITSVQTPGSPIAALDMPLSPIASMDKDIRDAQIPSRAIRTTPDSINPLAVPESGIATIRTQQLPPSNTPVPNNNQSNRSGNPISNYLVNYSMFNPKNTTNQTTTPSFIDKTLLQTLINNLPSPQLPSSENNYTEKLTIISAEEVPSDSNYCNVKIGYRRKEITLKLPKPNDQLGNSFVLDETSSNQFNHYKKDIQIKKQLGFRSVLLNNKKFEVIIDSIVYKTFFETKVTPKLTGVVYKT